MARIQAEATIGLLDSTGSDRGTKDALVDLFAGDGTIYVVSGYFTYQGYLDIRPAVVSFLDRSPDNELVAIVGPASDQFSSRIARDLWALDDADQVRLLKQPRGLHAKLYLRDGPEPTYVLSSANITRVAFEYNVELGLEVSRADGDHPDLRPFTEWAERLAANSKPLRRRDILGPVQVGSSFVNWSNKARLLPRRNVALRVLPVVLFILLFAGLFRLV